MKRTIGSIGLVCLLTCAAFAVPLNPLPGQAFIYREDFSGALPAGWDLAPAFVPYPHAASWKTPGASEVLDGMLTSGNKNGAVKYDVSEQFGFFGVDLTNASVALYMRLWTAEASQSPRVTLGFMNYAAEEPAPSPDLARYVGGYVRNSNNPMVGWGGKADMDNQADGVGLQKQGLDTAGWYDYAFLLDGNGSSIAVSAFQKGIDETEWTALAGADDAFSIDTGYGFDSRSVFLWSRDNANIWKIDDFAISEVPEPATLALLALGGMVLRRRRG